MPIRTVGAETLKSWLDKGEAVLVDVREPAEYAAENIPGATLIPIGGMTKQALPDISGKKLVIHCRSGKRGGMACEKLLAEDPNLDVYNLEGGISAWSAAGNAVKTSGTFFLPLDRQVQLTIGMGVLLGSVLGYAVNPAFFIIPAFFGLGLTFAGLSGTCGLALLLAKMPWNQNAKAPVSFCSIK